jgi:hypothetical protein
LPSKTLSAAAFPRFWNKVSISSDGCWHWTAGLNSHGYGAFGIDGSMVGAHRIAYEYLIGPVPAGLVLDHVVCNNRRCVNPFHVKPVTSGENASRPKREMTHCKRGHPFTAANTLVYTPPGRGPARFCRECRRIRDARRRK